MDTFGYKLKHERQQGGLSIQAVSQILGVDSERLFALERNDFEALPDESVVKVWLRAYAECLGVDADLMIEDYLRERDQCLRKLEDAVTEQDAEILPAVTPTRAHPRSPFGRLFAATVILAAVALGAWWLLSGGGIAPTTKAPESTVAPHPAIPETPIAVAPIPPERSARRPTPPAPAVSSSLGIPDHGVGTGIENRQLVGRSDRFSEGTEVWFLTHVQGGSPGDTIHHVWLQQGVESWRIALRVGGPRWRTYSAKKLHPGSAGDWAVEARDDAGRVLARRDFLCVR